MDFPFRLQSPIAIGYRPSAIGYWLLAIGDWRLALRRADFLADGFRRPVRHPALRSFSEGGSFSVGGRPATSLATTSNPQV
jgi:hypothetical protein